ncbi:MAG: hypothetical protein V4532_07390 [Pseudomonadota bacterium]
MARAVQQLSQARSRLPWLACCAAVLVLHGAALAWMVRPERAVAQAPAKTGPPVIARLLSVGASDAATPLASPAEPLSDAKAPVSVDQGATAADDARDGTSPVDLEGYVPRQWLTVGPQPTAPVLLAFPTSFQDKARYIVVLNLFIEADGRVARVQFEGEPLPEVLERVARSTFEHARFTPGQVRGRIVKSLIKVEVSFDNLGAG